MLSIRIDCEPDRLDEHMKALGYSPVEVHVGLTAFAQAARRGEADGAEMTGGVSGPTEYVLTQGASKAVGTIAEPNSTEDYTGPVTSAEEVGPNPYAEVAAKAFAQPESNDEPRELGKPPELAAPFTGNPTRERGKPSEGRQRRTKAEIAEDEAVDKADAERKAARQAKYEADVKAEMLKPDPQPAPTVTLAEGKTSDITDINAAVKRLMDKVGPANAPTTLRTLLGKPIVEIADTDIPAAIAKIDAFIAGEPVTAAEIVDEPAPAAEAEPWAKTPATRDDLKKAMLAYRDLNDDTAAYIEIDGAFIFRSALGEPPATSIGANSGKPVWKVSTVPDELLQKTVFYWMQATTPDGYAAIKAQRP